MVHLHYMHGHMQISHCCKHSVTGMVNNYSSIHFIVKVLASFELCQKSLSLKSTRGSPNCKNVLIQRKLNNTKKKYEKIVLNIHNEKYSGAASYLSGSTLSSESLGAGFDVIIQLDNWGLCWT